MIPTALVLGVVAEGVAWWWISSRGASVWATMTPVLVGLGIVALLTGRPEAATEVTVGTAAGVGLAAGLVLYGATRAFVALAAPRWRAFREQSISIYGRRDALSPWAVLGVSIVLMVPGEELFWRGLFLPEMQDAAGAVAGAVVAWGVFLVANLPSRNLAITAGAAVGGAAWVGLSWWSGGVVAPLLCHAAWTAFMLALPPVPTTAGATR